MRALVLSSFYRPEVATRSPHAIVPTEFGTGVFRTSATLFTSFGRGGLILVLDQEREPPKNVPWLAATDFLIWLIEKRKDCEKNVRSRHFFEAFCSLKT